MDAEKYLISQKEKLQFGVLYSNLADILREGIRLEIFAKKSCLPTENSITQILNISRVTVRKALQILEKEGLLIRQPGSGTFIQDTPSYNLSHNIGFKESITKQGHSVREDRLLYKIIPIPQFLINIFTADKEVYYLKRLRYIDNIPASIEEVWLPITLCSKKAILQNSLYNYLSDMKLSPVFFTRKFFADSCSKSDSIIFKIPVATPVLSLYQKGFTSSNQLIEYSKIVCRSGVYELSESLFIDNNNKI